MTTPPDPAAFFRTMLGEWEKMANGLGQDMLKTDEWARAMHGANAATLNAQAAMRSVMERGLAAANLPNRAEIEDLSARLGRIEETLQRIETRMASGPAAGKGKSASAKPKPSRGRKPPDAAD